MSATAVSPSSIISTSPTSISGRSAAGGRSATAAPGAAAPRRSGPPRSGGASHNQRFPNRQAGEAKGAAATGGPSSSTEQEILFQKFFKSVGPRTYAAQVKRAKNGNHYLVLMEGKRDEASGDVRKTRLFVYSEDFVEFFRLIKSAAEFIKQNPLPNNVREKREQYWARQSARDRRGTGAASGRK
jgi:hypothetical protein